MPVDMLSNSPVKIDYSSNKREIIAQLDIPKAHGMPITSEQVLLAIETAGAGDWSIDYVAVDRLVQGQNKQSEQKMVVARQIDGGVESSISKDKMEAFIVLKGPQGGKVPEVEDVMMELVKSNVKYGIKQDLIENLIVQQWYNERVLIAEGKFPEDGEDGKVVYFFNTEEAGPKPTLTEDGNVDFHELNIIQNVVIGDTLLERIPPTPGVLGMNVLGEELRPKAGKDIPLPMGKGTIPSSDNSNVLVAEISGQPRLIQGKVCVLPIFEIKGDVDYSTGNVNFVGDIIVRGGVKEGFVVRADGNITINGPVAGCVIDAGGNVILNKGMHGQDKGAITAGEDIAAKFLEHTAVRAGGNVRVTDAVLHSDVQAKKNVYVEGGKKGIIVGGRICAGEEVKAKVIGNPLATPTEIEAGGSPKVREELRQIEEQKKNLKLNLDRTEKGVKSLKALQEKMGGLPPDKKDLLLQLTRAQFHIMGQVKKLEAREEELEELLASSYKGRVTVMEAIYPGVKVIIKQAILHIRDTINATSFYEQDGEVHVGVYG